MAKAFTIFFMNEMFGIVLVLSAFLSTASAVDCQGKSFHCVNSTHFMICVDLGGGISQSIDNFFIACPPPTVCQGTNHFECEFPAPTTPSTTLADTTPPWDEVVTVTSSPGNTNKEFSEKYTNTDRITTVLEDSFTADATIEFATAATSEIYYNNELHVTKTLSTIAEETATTAKEIATQPDIQNINLSETAPAVVSAAQESTRIAIETVTLVTENLNVTEQAVTEVIPTTGIKLVTIITTEDKNPTEIFIAEAPTTTVIETETQSTINNINVTVPKTVTDEVIAATITETVTQSIDDNKDITASEPAIVAEVITTPVVEVVTQPSENMNVTESVSEGKKTETTDMETVTQSTTENINITVSKSVTAEEIAANVIETVTHTLVKNNNKIVTKPVVFAEDLTTPFVEMLRQPTEIIYVTESIPTKDNNISTTVIETVTRSTETVFRQVTVEETAATATETATPTAVENKNAIEPEIVAEELTTPVVEMVPQPTDNIIAAKGKSTEPKSVYLVEDLTTISLDTTTQPAIYYLNVTEIIPATAEELGPTVIETVISENNNEIATEPVVLAEKQTNTIQIGYTPVAQKNNVRVTSATPLNFIETIANTKTEINNLTNSEPKVTGKEMTLTTTETLVQTITEPTNRTKEKITTTVEDTINSKLPSLGITEKIQHPASQTSSQSSNIVENDVGQQSVAPFEASIVTTELPNADETQMRSSQLPLEWVPDNTCPECTTDYTTEIIVVNEKTDGLEQKNTQNPVDTALLDGILDASSKKSTPIREENLTTDTTSNLVTVEAIPHIPTTQTVYINSETIETVYTTTIKTGDKSTSPDSDDSWSHGTTLYPIEHIENSLSSGDNVHDWLAVKPNKLQKTPILIDSNLKSNDGSVIYATSNVEYNTLQSQTTEGNYQTRLMTRVSIEKNDENTDSLSTELVSQTPATLLIITENLTNSYVTKSKQSDYDISTQSSIGASASSDILTINKPLETKINSVLETKNQLNELDTSDVKDPANLKIDSVGKGIDSIWTSPTVMPTKASFSETTIIDGVHNNYRTIGSNFNIVSESPAKGPIEETTTNFTPSESNVEESSVLQVNISVKPEENLISTNVHSVVAFTNIPLSTEFTPNSQMDTVIVTESYQGVTLNPTFRVDVSDLATVSIDEGPNLNLQFATTDRNPTNIPSKKTFNFQTGYVDRGGDFTENYKLGDSFSYQSGVDDGASEVAVDPEAGALNLNIQTGIGYTSSNVTKVGIIGGPTFNPELVINDGISEITAVPKVKTPISNAETEIMARSSDVHKIHTVGDTTEDSQFKIKDPSLASNIVVVSTVEALIFKEETGVTDTPRDVLKTHVAGTTDNSQTKFNGVSDITVAPIVAVPLSNSHSDAIVRSSGAPKINPLGELIINSQTRISDKVSDIFTVPVEASTFKPQIFVADKSNGVTKIHTAGSTIINSQAGNIVRSKDNTAGQTTTHFGGSIINSQSGNNAKTNANTAGQIVGPIINSQSGNIVRTNDNTAGQIIATVLGKAAIKSQSENIVRTIDNTAGQTVGGPIVNSQSGNIVRAHDDIAGQITTTVVGGPTINSQSRNVVRTNNITAGQTGGGATVNSQPGNIAGVHDDITGQITTTVVAGLIINSQSGNVVRTNNMTAGQTGGGATVNSQPGNIVGAHDDITGQITTTVVAGPTINSQSGNVVRTNDNITARQTGEGLTVDSQTGNFVRVYDDITGQITTTVGAGPTINSQSGNAVRINNITAGQIGGGPTVNSQSGNVVRNNNNTLAGQIVRVESLNPKSQKSAHSLRPSSPQNNSSNLRTVSPNSNSTVVTGSLTWNNKTKLSQQNISNTKVTVQINKQIQKTNTTTTVQPPTNTVISKQMAPITNTVIKRVPNDTSLTYTCINGMRGRYSDKDDCRKFYICVGNSQPIVGYCPENTVFSDLKKLCTKNMSHCIRENQFKCPSAGRFTDFINYNVYYICVYHKSHLYRFKFQCQKGYVLNKATVKCIETKEIESNESVSISSSDSSSQSSSVSENSNSSRSNTGISNKDKSSKNKRNKETAEKPEQKEDDEDVFKCEKEGKFPIRNDCRRYYLCKKHGRSQYRRKVKKCESGDVFHKSKKKCVDADSYEC